MEKKEMSRSQSKSRINKICPISAKTSEKTKVWTSNSIIRNKVYKPTGCRKITVRNPNQPTQILGITSCTQKEHDNLVGRSVGNSCIANLKQHVHTKIKRDYSYLSAQEQKELIKQHKANKELKKLIKHKRNQTL